MMACFAGIPLFLILLEGAEPSARDWWDRVLLVCLVAPVATPLAIATMEYVWKFGLARTKGSSTETIQWNFRLGTFLDGLSVTTALIALGFLTFSLNVYYDTGATKFSIPVLSSFHLTGQGGNGRPQDLYVLELKFPARIQREPVACFSSNHPRLKQSDILEGETGSGWLGWSWYRFSETFQSSMVNRGLVYESGLESESFGHLSLYNAMREGRVHARGRFAPGSACRDLLRRHNVEITEEAEPSPSAQPPK
ncbi:MAG: hypothetical protein HQM10_13545 [Candidatus Riflebacteria bacterium]|nr:hypothetical protein [Candidatus Riflebacteria bacterium]